VAVITLLLLTLWPSEFHSKTQSRLSHSSEPIADFNQAEMMLRLLQSSVRGPAPSELIESVLNAEGTSLIIRQQNISRRVTREQYEVLLANLNREQPPDVGPVDTTERAMRGLDGLRKDVWPALHWGRSNTPLLAERIREIRQLRLLRSSTALASRFLPEVVSLSPRLYVVMGGRAGAATLEDSKIYFDVLVTSYRAANGTLNYPTASQIKEYFAHEIHHLGLSRIIDRTRNNLQLNAQEQLAFSFITALVMEGSASYLINGHRNLEVMRRDPQFTANLDKVDELLKRSEEVLRSVLDDDLKGDAYEKAITPFLGSGWHVAGAIMFAAIDRAEGLKGVKEVLRDPRRLLFAYNKAIEKMRLNSKNPQIESGLAKTISTLGNRL
jgi:hypothetical protein